jgi:gliding motility-associated protein GldM
MSLPKEPRQKMINMMYLVLTALLALNVSSEILNAFKTIDRSLNNASGIASKKSEDIYKSFDEKIKDPQFAEKAQNWKSKATQASKLSKTIYDYLESFKAEVRKEAGGEMKEGKMVYKEDDLEAATRTFIVNGKGKEVEDKMNEFKKQILAIDPQIATAFATALPIDMSVPESQTGTVNNDWAYNNFHMTPAVAAITILSKLQNDIRNSESAVVDYCHSQVGQIVFKYDKFQAFIGANTQYVLPGQEVKIKAGIGAFSSAAKPTITINGSPTNPNENGVAEFTDKPGSSKKYVVKVSFKTPDGNDEVREETIDVTVGTATGAAASADKMNVLYIGVDNPMTISSGSIKRETAKFGFNGGSLSNVGGDKFIARPSASPGKYNITVSGDGGSPASFEFRVKYLPNPVALVGASKGGPMSAAQFRAMGGVRAVLEDSEFDAAFVVLGYRMGFSGKGFPDYQGGAVGGAQWSSQSSSISKCIPGSIVYIEEIKVKGPDGKERTLPGGLIFRLN